MSEINSEQSQYYVYIYRDERKKVRYVGYGKSSKRAFSHETGGHNKALNEFILTQKYSIEIAGPFGSKMTGQAVETALISSLKPDCNINLGPEKWRFRPLGIPENFAERLTLPLLERKDFIQLTHGLSASPLLFVRISDIDFDDGRVGYNPGMPPDEINILERMDRWWQLNSYIDGWIKTPSTCPHTLLGVTGSPGAQIIIGSVFIDPKQWHNSLRDGSLCQVPTQGPKDLDAFNLRGRKISPDANLKFGPNRNQTFLVLDSAGRVTGGRPSSRG